MSHIFLVCVAVLSQIFVSPPAGKYEIVLPPGGQIVVGDQWVLFRFVRDDRLPLPPQPSPPQPAPPQPLPVPRVYVGKIWVVILYPEENTPKQVTELRAALAKASADLNTYNSAYSAISDKSQDFKAFWDAAQKHDANVTLPVLVFAEQKDDNKTVLIDVQKFMSASEVFAHLKKLRGL